MEIINELGNPLIAAVVMVIVGLIKNLPVINKIPTRFVSFVVSLVVLTLTSVVSPSVTLLLTLENVILVILPAIGYDYIYAPFIKPIFDLFKSKA
jgi:hypothetical protein